MPSLPLDYIERVYAGVLGKLIGVYLGRPFEGRTYEWIIKELGEVGYYVNERFGLPLVVTDDDIAGTFTFLRALPDNDNPRDLAPQRIGEAWLNYIVEGKTILWWGGLGNSTEHTAYLRLKRGIPAPLSGSSALNGVVIAEQIGAQIFIDGWGMVAPGDPELAADLARRAASVSHDGEAIYAAQVVAGMEAAAFTERDLNRLLDIGKSLIPGGSRIRALISDVQEWHAGEPDWHRTRQALEVKYGYDRYPGNCHVVPNHGVIILALLYGQGDFHRSLAIANTCGWDTDCNSGNVGCLLGIRNGLQGIDGGPDWRGPVADRLYLSTADGGRAITDAVIETYHIANIARSFHGEEPLRPKSAARFHFELPGSVQGFHAETGSPSPARVRIENVAGTSPTGTRALALQFQDLPAGGAARMLTPTFIPPEAIDMPGYPLLASPTLYSGQAVRAGVLAAIANGGPVTCRLLAQVYGAGDGLDAIAGPSIELAPGSLHGLRWRVDDTGGRPVAAIGVEVRSRRPANGTVFLDYLTWEGAPDALFTRPAGDGQMWRRAWVNAVDEFPPYTPEPFRVIQNRGRGLLIQGTREWRDYRATAVIRPWLLRAAGLGIRVQGMQRYYALLLAPGRRAQLVKVRDGTSVLAEISFRWRLWSEYELSLQAVGARLQAWIDGRLVCDLLDESLPLDGGGIALICEEGCLSADWVRVQPGS